MKTVKVKNNKTLLRDTKSKAIINNNIEDRQKKLMKKQYLVNMRIDLDTLIKRIDELENKIKEK